VDDKERLSLSIYGILLDIRDTFSLPTHATLEKTFYYSLIMLVCSIISQLTGFYTFISWYGCLTCVVTLVILLWIERSENDALLKMYRTAKLSTEKALRRAKAASAYNRDRRNSTGYRGRTEVTRKGEQCGDSNQNQRHNEFHSSNQKH